ncbi:MAG: sigma 54-interacting transcriptional regulator [Sandaracinaceae bacterium]
MTDDRLRTVASPVTPRAAGGRRLRAYRLEVFTPGLPPREQEVTEARVRVGSRGGADIEVDDPKVSRLHLELRIDEHGYRLTDLGSTNGTFVDGVRALDVYLRPEARIRVGDSELRLRPLDREVEVPLADGDRFGPLLGRSVAMREVFALLARAARSDATILVEGESGTGKELVAEAVHAASPRAGGPFVVFDCAAIPADLLESELFGHERGAFTGATTRRLGRLEEADGGTLFLDELGELPLELQPKLLRALERREVRRLGGTTSRTVDVRLVAATNRDLAQAVNQGAFREDLYYRLAVVRVVLPPLRERPDDIPLLVEHLIGRALPHDPERAADLVASLSAPNLARLKAHPWPGNVRELANLIERTLVLSGGDDPVSLEPPTLRGEAAAGPAEPPAGGVESEVDLDRPFSALKQEVVARFEAAYLRRQLARFDGNFSRAAAASSLDRMYFKRLLRKHRHTSQKSHQDPESR